MATWKKVLVSGSSAEVSQLSVGANQQITTAQATTSLTGSFTGSFVGSGVNLSGVTATFPGSNLTPLLSTTRIFSNDGVSNTSNTYVTAGQITGSAYAGVTGDITILPSGLSAIGSGKVTSAMIVNDTITNDDINSAAAIALSKLATGALPTAITIASANITNDTITNDDINSAAAIAYSKLNLATSTIHSGSFFNGITVVSGSAQITYSGLTGVPVGIVSSSAQVLNGSGVFSGSAQLPSGIVSGSSQVSYTGLSNTPANIVSGSSLGSSTQGQVALTTNGVTQTAINLTGLTAASTPTFAGISTTGNITTTTVGSISIFPSNATTVNAFGAATTLNLGSATGTTTVANSLIVTGDLFVNGTTTQVNTTDLLVEDKFILLASGSATAGDGGIIIDRGSDAAGNIAYGFDAATDRWGFQSGITDTSNALDPTSASGVSGSFAVYSFTQAAHGATKPITGEFAVVGSQYLDDAGNFWVYTV